MSEWDTDGPNRGDSFGKSWFWITIKIETKGKFFNLGRIYQIWDGRSKIDHDVNENKTAEGGTLFIGTMVIKLNL